MHDHAKMMWGCGVILVGIILGTAGVDVGGAAVLAIPCILMMG